MVFEEFYDYKLFSQNYMYRRNWIGCSYEQQHYGMRFEHFIASHGKVYRIIVEVKNGRTEKEVANFSIHEMSRKMQHHKDNIETTMTCGFVITMSDAKDLTLDELYQLIIDSSLNNYVKNHRVESLLRGPTTSYNRFADHINLHLEKMRG